jgi:hypothetical protein
VCKASFETYDFLLVNSSFHGDHSRGEVDLVELERVYETCDSDDVIVVTHHSPLSSVYGGNALVNGYELLAWASRRQILSILHGHIHTEQVLQVGGGVRSTTLLGVGSLMFTPDPNYNNQFSILEYDDSSLKRARSFRFQGDRHGFVEQVIPWV